MRIIHTSDWHLGRRFHAASLLDAQAEFADWFVSLAATEEVDLVVIAGDIYDRAIAPTEAIELFGRVVGRLLDAGVVVAAITGNHDAADRVAPYDELLDRSGFYLRGGYERAGEVITHDFADGPLDLVLVPYLDPRAAPAAFLAEHAAVDDADDGSAAGPDDADERDASADDPHGTTARARRAATHESVLDAVLRSARAASTAPRSLVVSHAFVAGGSVSDSERDLVVGGTGQVDASLFDGFSYGALGHLHRPQRVAGSDVLRYSGTPMAYSFSEDHDKSVTVVDMDTAGVCTTRAVPVPVGRRVATVEGTMDELLDPSAHPGAHDAFVRAFVTDRETVLDARARLATVYPHVMEIHLTPAGVGDETDGRVVATRRADPLDVVTDFWEHVEGTPPDDASRDLLRAAVEAAVGADDPGGVVV